MKVVIISPFQFRLNRGIERFVYSLTKELSVELEIIIYTWGSTREVYWGDWNRNVKIRKVPNFRYFIRSFAAIYYRLWLWIDRPQKVIVNFLYHGENTLPSHLDYLYVLNSPASQVPQRYKYIQATLQRFPKLSFSAVSSMVAREALPYISGREIAVINNGVDTNRFKPNLDVSFPSSKLRIITAAALEKRKGIQWVINGLKHFKELDFEYHIYGEGPYKSEIEKTIRNQGLEHKVKLRDPINNLHEVLPNYHIFCLLSKGEAFALAPIEALACGLPLIVSQYEPYPEFMQSSFGLMIDREIPEQLVSAIETIAADYPRMSEEARKVSLNFDWSQIAREYQKLI